MKISIEGKNIELTDAIKSYVHDKLKRLEKHYESIIKGHEVRVKLSVLKNPRISNKNITEVTVFLDRKIIRSEQDSEDMYASIDLVTDKLERQIQKYKSKHYRSYAHNERPEFIQETASASVTQSNGKNKEQKIIKSKKFKLHPMTPEEAQDQLDLIGHDFFVFVNSRTSHINVIYERKDGNYGLIEPVL